MPGKTVTIFDKTVENGWAKRTEALVFMLQNPERPLPASKTFCCPIITNDQGMASSNISRRFYKNRIILSQPLPIEFVQKFFCATKQIISTPGTRV